MTFLCIVFKDRRCRFSVFAALATTLMIIAKTSPFVNTFFEEIFTPSKSFKTVAAQRFSAPHPPFSPNFLLLRKRFFAFSGDKIDFQIPFFRLQTPEFFVFSIHITTHLRIQLPFHPSVFIHPIHFLLFYLLVLR